MIIRDINKINTNGKKARDAVADVEKFVINPDVSNGRVLVLYGLRRTGKTTIMEQVLENHRDNRRCAFYEVEDNDTLDDVKKVIIDEKYKGVTLICFDEITKANDFITNSAALPDVFAKEGITIVLTGTDSLGFQFAEDNELYDRVVRINTTHVPFAEHCRVLDTNDIDDYIEYGGLMKKGLEKDDRIVHDYYSACRYLDSAVAENIARSVKRNPEDNCLEDLSKKELKAIIEKLVEAYSGKIDRKLLQNKLRSASISYVEKKYTDILEEDIIDRLVMEKSNIVRDFLEKVNADESIKTPITKEMIDTLERYLINMNVLSTTPQTDYHQDDAVWTEGKTTHEYYLIQPAIKYYHLQEAKKFIESEKYYKELSTNEKQYLESKLDEKIKGDMTEQIILYDVFKSLDKKQYLVTKPVFFVDGQRKGEYDMLIYDKQKNVHWGFEIKHTNSPFFKQEQHLQNNDFTEIMNKKYGHRENVCVLYRGTPFRATSGTCYLNISDFLQKIYKTPDVEKVMLNLTKNLPVKELPTKGSHDSNEKLTEEYNT